MRLGVFVSDYKFTVDTLDRLKAEKLGIIFVGNGVYHTAVKEKDTPSLILEKSSNLYAISEDLETRGFSSKDIDSRVKLINLSELVDLIFNDYEKLAWL